MMTPLIQEPRRLTLTANRLNWKCMEKTEKFFIFTWKELTVIVLLVLTLVGFFFTLGLHYGKKIAIPTHHSQVSETDEKLEEGPETVPPKENLEAGSNHEKPVVADTIKEATHEEVEHSGVKIEHSKATALPAQKVEASVEHKVAEPVAPVAATVAANSFYIQLGSYTNKKEAQNKVKSLAKAGVKTEIQTAEVNQVTRYRVLIAGFKSKGAADMHGRELKQKHKIDNYIVIKP